MKTLFFTILLFFLFPFFCSASQQIMIEQNLHNTACGNGDSAGQSFIATKNTLNQITVYKDVDIEEQGLVLNLYDDSMCSYPIASDSVLGNRPENMPINFNLGNVNLTTGNTYRFIISTFDTIPVLLQCQTGNIYNYGSYLSACNTATSTDLRFIISYNQDTNNILTTATTSKNIEDITATTINYQNGTTTGAYSITTYTSPFILFLFILIIICISLFITLYIIK